MPIPTSGFTVITEKNNGCLGREVPHVAQMSCDNFVCASDTTFFI